MILYYIRIFIKTKNLPFCSVLYIKEEELSAFVQEALRIFMYHSFLQKFYIRLL